MKKMTKHFDESLILIFLLLLLFAWGHDGHGRYGKKFDDELLFILLILLVCFC